MSEQTVDQPNNEVSEDLKDTEFFNVHHLTRTQPGIYLDEEERRHAEETRARLEDREPDYENMSSTAGTPLTTQAGAENILGVPTVNPDLQPVVTLPVDHAGVAGTVVSTSPVAGPEGATPEHIDSNVGPATTWADDNNQESNTEEE